MFQNYKTISLIALISAAACDDGAIVTSGNFDPISEALAPPGAPADSCWDKTTSPAIVETQTLRVLLQPAQISSDGHIQQPPIYKEKKQQVVVQPRRDNWFEIPCPNIKTPEFNASLQRALQARGYYSGAITGRFDLKTRNAVRRFQKSNGIGHPALTVEMAQRLGLIEIEIPKEA